VDGADDDHATVDIDEVDLAVAILIAVESRCLLDEHFLGPLCSTGTFWAPLRMRLVGMISWSHQKHAMNRTNNRYVGMVVHVLYLVVIVFLPVDEACAIDEALGREPTSLPSFLE
jgi:hypothetical protein